MAGIFRAKSRDRQTSDIRLRFVSLFFCLRVLTILCIRVNVVVFTQFTAMTTEIFQPSKYTDERGTEISLYVSSDGSRAGVSKRGLAALCGISHSTFTDTKGKFANVFNGTILDESEVPNCLKELVGIGLHAVEKSGQTNYNGDIITQEYAIAIIEYYAFEKMNPVAIKSYRAFAAMGFTSWVKQVTNFKDVGRDSDAIAMLASAIADINSQLHSMRRESANVVTVYQNMPTITQSTDMAALASSDFTVMEWLGINKFNISNGEYRSLVRRVSETFKSLTSTTPPRKRVLVEKENGKKVWTALNIYKTSHDGLLRAAYFKTIEDRRRNVKNLIVASLESI